MNVSLRSWQSVMTLWASLVVGASAQAQSAGSSQPVVGAPPAPSTEAPGGTPFQGAVPAEGMPKAAGAPLEIALPHTLRSLDDAVRTALAAWGCEPEAVVANLDRWYAACGSAGVFVVEQRDAATLVLSERRVSAGQVRAVFMRGSEVWVESTHTEARPFGELPTSGPIGALGAGRAPTTPLPPRIAAPPRLPSAQVDKPSKIAPPRQAGLWMFEGAVRPYLPLDSLAIAGLVDATATYRGERAWYAQAKLYPFGGTVGQGRDALLFGLTASAGYDHRYFSVGIGMGALRRSALHEIFDPAQDRVRLFVEGSIEFVVTQSARLGALDGLHLAVTNAFVLGDEQWNYGYLDLTIQVPINRQTWLTFAGGGGDQAGFFYSEVGLRRMLRGNGAGGSLYVRPSVGVAGIDNRYDGVQPGPLVGVHLEWRK